MTHGLHRSQQKFHEGRGFGILSIWNSSSHDGDYILSTQGFYIHSQFPKRDLHAETPSPSSALGIRIQIHFQDEAPEIGLIPVFRQHGSWSVLKLEEYLGV